MLNEFNTAIAAEGIKMIAEGCKILSEVCDTEHKEGSKEDAKLMIFWLSEIALANSVISRLIELAGSKIDTKAGDF